MCGINVEQLIAIMPFAIKRAANWVKPLNWAMQDFHIDNPTRIGMFLANVAHESGELLYVKEIASGAAYDTGRLAENLGNTPEKDGDGQRYKGRGPLMLTGADNYRRCGAALGLHLLEHPELLEHPVYGARAAAWFWEESELNELADTKNFQGVCALINTGNRESSPNRIRGYFERLRYYDRAKVVLGV